MPKTRSWFDWGTQEMVDATFEEGWYRLGTDGTSRVVYYFTKTVPRKEKKSRFLSQGDMVFAYMLKEHPKKKRPYLAYMGYMDWNAYGTRYTRIEGPTVG